jgi:branched-chain amino acid transport system substrate-binding protein
MTPTRLALAALAVLLAASPARAAEAPPARLILVGLDAEFGRPTGTADDAIKQGILIAIDEINAAGGLLGGRRLALVEKDNRSVPARAVQNTTELGANPDVVAMFCGRFSTVVMETLGPVHAASLPLLIPWAAADKLVDNGRTPNFVFRLSLRDSWAVPVMLDHALARGQLRIGLLLANVQWGRANHQLIEKLAPARGLQIAGVEWFNYGDGTIFAKYLSLLEKGPDAIVIVTSETEGAELVRAVAALPARQRRPLISHWSITGSDFPALTGQALAQVDLAVVQTWSLPDARGKGVERVLAAARRLFAKKTAAEIVSPVGLAHAYDLTHLLARAIERAGSTDRPAVRDALERLGPYEGLIKSYPQPFAPDRHEALSQSDVFMARYAPDGTLLPIRWQVNPLSPTGGEGKGEGAKPATP